MEEFKERLMDALNKKACGDLSIRHITVTKANDGKYEALTISDSNDGMASTFYLENLFEQYKQGEDIDNLAEEILRRSQKHDIAEEAQILNIVENLGDYPAICDHIIIRLLNLNMNKNYLKGKCYSTYLDFALCFNIVIKNDTGAICTLALPEEIFSSWKISMEQLFEQAIENMQRDFPARISEISDIISELYSKNEISRFMNSPVVENIGMYVFTNDKMINGASVILYKGLLKAFAESLGCEEIIIIPSSVNEMILVPGDSELACGLNEIEKMISEVNSTVVDKGEVLSDHPYIYNRNKDEIREYYTEKEE